MKRGIYREGFFKVSRRLLESSLWCESGDVMKVFVALVALSQDPASPRNGTVFIARRLLAAKCVMTEQALEDCLKVLAGPDPQSRTQTQNGRRIEVLPNGFRVLNYGLYHDEAKDAETSKARAKAGKVGGIESAKVRKAQADSLKQNGSKSKLLDGDKTETETERETDTRNGNGALSISPSRESVETNLEPCSSDKVKWEPVPMESRTEYAEAVREVFAEKTSRPTYQFTADDGYWLKRWMDAGIPLRLVLRELKATRGIGYKLAYYNSSVMQEHERVSLALSGTR